MTTSTSSGQAMKTLKITTRSHFDKLRTGKPEKRKRPFRCESEKVIKRNFSDTSKYAFKDFCTVQYTPMLDQNVSFTDHVTNSTYYYNQDERQSVKNLTDSTATVAQSYDYTAYGDRILSTIQQSSIMDQRYTFTGRELNEASGDYYFRYRMYGAGGFLSRDPLGYVDGMSVYSGYFAGGLTVDSFGKARNTIWYPPTANQNDLPYGGLKYLRGAWEDAIKSKLGGTPCCPKDKMIGPVSSTVIGKYNAVRVHANFEYSGQVEEVEYTWVTCYRQRHPHPHYEICGYAPDLRGKSLTYSAYGTENHSLRLELYYTTCVKEGNGWVWRRQDLIVHTPGDGLVERSTNLLPWSL